MPGEHVERPATVRGRHADVLLSDGSVACIRPVTVDDRDALVALHEGVSRDNSRLRFFSTSTTIGAAYVEHVLHSAETLALVVERRGELLGVGTAEITATGSAEIAFLVADRWHGLGVGSLLLEHLAAAGRDRGLRVLTAEVLEENYFMLRVLRDAGFTTSRRTEAGSVRLELSTTASAAAVRAADRREAVSEARSMGPLLSPSSVAVVGARRDGTGAGALVLRTILAAGYTGALHVVHPDADEVAGVPTVPGLADLPGGVDLVVVDAPADRVPAVLEAAVRVGCRGAVVLAGEHGGARADRREPEQGLLDAVRRGGLRLLGPHSLGVVDNDPAVRLNATAGCPVPPPGGLALASQSGSVGIVLAGLARQLGVGVRFLVSLGDKVDVSANDLLSAWCDAPDVTGVGLYLESFGNGAKLARLAREVGQHKPVMLVVGARSPDVPVAAGLSALAHQAGVLVCDTLEEVMQCAALLEGQPRPRGRRVAVLGDARGVAMLAADAARRAGLVVPELSDGLQGLLSPVVTVSRNPVEVAASADVTAVAVAAERLLGAGEVDALLVVLVRPGAEDVPAMVAALADVRSHRSAGPLLVVTPATPPSAVPAGITTYPTVAAAVDALARVATHEEWRRRPREPESQGPEEDTERAWRTRAAVRRLLEVPRTDGRLSPDEVSRLLADRGLVLDAVVGDGAEEPSAPGLLDSARAVEMVVGLSQDPTFGPLVVVGAGGPAADAHEDRQFLLPPFTADDAFRAIRGLRVWASLDRLGARTGGGPAALRDLLLRVACLAGEVPGIVQVDLDPVLVTPDACRLLGVEVRVGQAEGPDAGVPRRLRRPR